MLSYRLEKQPYNHRMMTIVTCPKCGEEGKLVCAGRRNLSGRRVYRIVHDYRNGKECSIGVLHPAYEFLDEVYERARRASND